MRILYIKKSWALLISAFVVAIAFWVMNVDHKVEEVEIVDDATQDTQETADIMSPEGPDEWDFDLDGDKDFFVEYRLQRDRVRSKEIERLNQFMDNPNTSEKAIEEAEEKLLEIITIMEKEMIIENLVRANGFEDALFFYREDSANIIIKNKELTEAEVSQIAEIIYDNTGTPMSNIKVIEYN